MFTRHLFKTIAGFCGMILFGLVSLVVIDHYKGKEEVKAPVVYAGTEDISEGSISAVKPKSTTAVLGEVKLLPYHEALGLYTGRRVELAGNCQAVPNTMTFKNNTKIMIDNKSDMLKTLKIGKTTTTVKARGFKIMNLSSSKLPAKLALDCDASKAAASITLEK
jgi:hypothetical protein